MAWSIAMSPTMLAAAAFGACAAGQDSLESGIAHKAADPVMATSLENDRAAAAMVREMLPVCREATPECEQRNLEEAVARSRRGRSWVTIASDAGSAYSIYQEELRDQANLRPRLWILGQHPPGAGSPGGYSTALWQLDCRARTYAVVTEIWYRDDSTAISSRAGDAVPIQAEPGTLPGQLVERICRYRSGTPPALPPVDDIVGGN